MRIDNKINQSNFKEIADLLSQATCSINFWGNKVVTAQDYEGSILLNDLQDRVKALIQANINFNLEDRGHGRRVSQKITEFYADVFTNYQGSNCLTKFFHVCTISKEISKKGSYALDWELNISHYFDLYTEAQWKEAFPEQPIPAFSFYRNPKRYSPEE